MSRAAALRETSSAEARKLSSRSPPDSLVAVSVRVMGLLLLIYLFVEEQVVDPAQHGADHHKAVGQVENGILKQLDVEHIHHVAAKDSVDQIAQAAAQDQQAARHAQRVADDPLDEQHNHTENQHRGEQFFDFHGSASPCKMISRGINKEGRLPGSDHAAGGHKGLELLLGRGLLQLARRLLALVLREIDEQTAHGGQAVSKNLVPVTLKGK